MNIYKYNFTDRDFLIFLEMANWILKFNLPCGLITNLLLCKNYLSIDNKVNKVKMPNETLCLTLSPWGENRVQYKISIYKLEFNSLHFLICYGLCFI